MLVLYFFFVYLNCMIKLFVINFYCYIFYCLIRIRFFTHIIFSIDKTVVIIIRFRVYKGASTLEQICTSIEYGNLLLGAKLHQKLDTFLG